MKLLTLKNTLAYYDINSGLTKEYLKYTFVRPDFSSFELVMIKRGASTLKHFTVVIISAS
jgi:hypothetical protein